MNVLPGAALGCLFVLPRPPWGSPHYGEILLLVWFLARARDLREAWNDLSAPAPLLLLALAAATGLALAAGRVPPIESALVLLRTAEGLLVFALARRDGPELGAALVWGGAAAAVVGIGEILLTPPPLVARAFETWSFGEANHFAALLALAAVILARERPAALPLVLLALLFTGSRTAILACAVGLAAGHGRRGLLALGALGAVAFLLRPEILFDRELLPQAVAASPHAPRAQTWRLLLPPPDAVAALLGRGAGFAPHRFYEAEWARLWVEGGALACAAAGALVLSLLKEERGRPVLFTILFLGLGMNVLLAGRVALAGALLLGAARRPA